MSQEVWAPFPDDNISLETLRERFEAVRAFTEKIFVPGLRNQDFETRRASLYALVNPLHDITKSFGRPVTLNVTESGSSEIVGRENAAFVLELQELQGFEFLDKKITEIDLQASRDMLTITLFEDSDDGIPRVFLFVSLEGSVGAMMNFYAGRFIFEEHVGFNMRPGDVLMPDDVKHLESMLLMAASAVTQKVKI